MREKIPVPQKLLLTVEEAAEYSHIGEKKIREMMNDIDCNFAFRKGTVMLIKRTKFEQYILGSAKFNKRRL